MILMIDNYDSFTFNLVQYFGELGMGCEVHRNDEIDLQGIEGRDPRALVISPGPGSPSQAGISKEAILRMAGKVPILGVCLGHQCIGSAFGAKVVRAQRPMHGKSSFVEHDGKGLYRGLPNPLRTIRYHSLVIDPNSMPSCLEVTARSEAGEIMGVRHRRFPIEGVQFHPESIMTEGGKTLLRNFLNLIEGKDGTG